MSTTFPDSPRGDAARQADERLRCFYELSSRAQAGDEAQPMLEWMLDMALRLTGACRGLLLLRSADQQQPSLAVARGWGQPLGQQTPAGDWMGNSLIQAAFAQGEPRLVAELHAAAHSGPAADQAWWSDGVGQAALVVPVCLDKQVVGVVYLEHAQQGGFAPDDAEFLGAFAAQGVLCAYRGQQYTEQTHQAEEQSRHLSYLNKIGSALTRSLDLNRVLQVVITGVNELLGTERTSVFLIDEATNELVLRYSNDGDADIRLPAPWQGIAGWVATHDRPTRVNDARNDPRHLRQFALDTGYEAHSILCVPLKVEGRVIGVVQVLNKTDDQPFTLHHQELLIDLTRWAAIALHNARLFDERVRAYQHLQAEQERRIAAETRGAMATVVLDMAHTMNNIIGAIRVWALTLEREPLAGAQAAVYKQMVGHIRQNAEEAIDLIRTMRGPLEHATIVPTDVHSSLDRAIQSCWLPDAIQIDVVYGHDVPLVQANPTRLEAVFQNVVSNAIQALGDTSGALHIRTCRTQQGKAEITISDTGPGIAPEVQAQLFTPGVSDQEGRLGIGLWLVETFVHQFGGKIAWNSTMGQGTTFVITLLPMAPENAAEGGTDDATGSYSRR
jgi:signal transduction histidine kinase